MDDLKRIPLPELLELLVEQTARYLAMIKDKSNGGFTEMQGINDCAAIRD